MQIEYKGIDLLNPSSANQALEYIDMLHSGCENNIIRLFFEKKSTFINIIVLHKLDGKIKYDLYNVSKKDDYGELIYFLLSNQIEIEPGDYLVSIKDYKCLYYKMPIDLKNTLGMYDMKYNGKYFLYKGLEFMPYEVVSHGKIKPYKK